jgi:hypothetical protein
MLPGDPAARQGQFSTPSSCIFLAYLLQRLPRGSCMFEIKSSRAVSHTDFVVKGHQCEYPATLSMLRALGSGRDYMLCWLTGMAILPNLADVPCHHVRTE